ncbi:DUF421 domain-containing protein [Alicyclobacillus fastidiosus]|uniref:DUF421 domain-containing protein n=1 Tax=Alicyclobacillus fastidiosus TaxID=392011 RepID=A0ABY6ZCL2_9BACL|nr:DUF421 domain-containing protein [Alicyclobacillus fastidiosus]WAH39996.1 DUF421 domain-containing protein [Alicyclobacillus fastidiosus]GMA61288.1 hypothetical protein GCM10025859_17280 [Alicyclobacillus fastidiosus]
MTIWEVLIQSLISFIVLFILARIMGKRQVAQLNFFDYIVGITIGNIAASWSLDEVKNVHAIASLLVWTIAPLIIAFIQRKSYRGRIILDGKQQILVQEGQVLEKNVKKANINIEELMQLLRQKDIFKLSDVEFAILETNGSLSAMKKSELQPVTPKDTGIQVINEREPRLVIIDGHVMERSLQQTGYSREWLLGEIMKQGASDVKDVFIAQIDSNGSVYVDLYHDSIREPQIKEKPLLAATLKKLQADMMSFALETNNPRAKESYTQGADVLEKLIKEVTPFLKE